MTTRYRVGTHAGGARLGVVPEEVVHPGSLEAGGCQAVPADKEDTDEVAR
jgi:hypothetical protein